MIVAAQMPSRLVAVAAIVGALSLEFAVPAAAQAPTGSTEWFAGYSYLRAPGNSILAATAGDDAFSVGWAAGADRRVWRAVSLVGEASGHYKSRTTLVDEVALSFHAFLGGPRASARIGRVTEFGQVLAGVVHGSGSAFGTTVTSTDLSVQPGGGLDYAFARRLAARLELDYRWIKGSGGRNHASQFRAVAAIVVR
jgi:hypothetical protein